MFQKNPYAHRTTRIKTTNFYIDTSLGFDMGLAGTDDLKEPGLEGITKEIRDRIYDDQGNQVVFLVGAGVSKEEPSSVPQFPQEPCLQQLPDLRGMDGTLNELGNRVRPEFFFQILHDLLGERGLLPLEVLNTCKLNKRGAGIRPNTIHEFLAEMLDQGHIVLTTNFDSLIEDAYLQRTDEILKKCAIYDADFDRLAADPDSAAGCLIKLHGSFYSPSGEDTKDSIVTLLYRLQSAAAQHKTDLIRALLADHDWIVLGHSMRDEYDLYPVLSDPRILKKKIYWIKHCRDPGACKITCTKGSFSPGLRAGESHSLSTIPWAEVSIKNIHSLLSSYGDGAGILIETNTLQFINSLRGVAASGARATEPGGGCNIADDIIRLWSESLNTIEQKKLSAELLRYLNTREGNEKALTLFKEASLESIKHLIAQVDLAEADTAYRRVRERMDQAELSPGQQRAHTALQTFTDLHDREGVADACYVLTHLNRLQNQATEGVKYGFEALQEYTTLVKTNRMKLYKLAQALRSLALVTMNAVPDLPPLTNRGQKQKLQALLQSCSSLCALSTAIYDEIGNVTGEGGPNQTLNVHGLVALRMGDYAQAEKLFEDYMHLSDASRFIRESHQGYRNLGLCELSLAMETEADSAAYGNRAIESFRKSLGCLGLDPDRLEEVLASDGQRWKNAAVFNTLYNYGKALVVCPSRDKAIIMRVLKGYNNKAGLETLLGPGAWNWQCRLLALLCQAEEDDTEAEVYAEEMRGIYELKGVGGIRKLRFGPQNYNENVKTVLDRLPSLKWDGALPKIMKVTVSLPFNASDLTEKLGGLDSEVRKVLDAGW
jgi:hypothetical protein